MTLREAILYNNSHGKLKNATSYVNLCEIKELGTRLHCLSILFLSSSVASLIHFKFFKISGH